MTDYCEDCGHRAHRGPCNGFDGPGRDPCDCTSERHAAVIEQADDATLADKLIAWATSSGPGRPPKALAEQVARRLLERSVLLNRVAWRVAELAGRIEPGATEHVGDVFDDLEVLGGLLHPGNGDRP